jgi:cardiolipin synthase
MLFYVAIQSAEKSIFIENAYFLPDKQVRLALVEAVKRGVDVRVIVPGSKIDIPPVRSASRLHYGGMLSEGVRIFEYAPTMMHSKTMVVDGLYSTIGTINFDSRSMLKNAEVSLAFYDPAFAAQLEAMFKDDLRKCHEISYAEWSDRGLRRRISELFSWIFEPYYERTPVRGHRF